MIKRATLHIAAQNALNLEIIVNSIIFISAHLSHRRRKNSKFPRLHVNHSFMSTVGYQRHPHVIRNRRFRQAAPPVPSHLMPIHFHRFAVSNTSQRPYTENLLSTSGENTMPTCSPANRTARTETCFNFFPKKVAKVQSCFKGHQLSVQ
jgi:hypothetical protein